MTFASFRNFRARALAFALLWLGPRGARAEEAISYKYEDYREMGGRIAVRTQGALLEKDLGTEMHLKLEGVLDAIAGATPTGEPAPAGSDQVPLAELHDRRKAWNGTLSRQFGRINVALGAGNSRESDYVSTGWSANTVTDFNQKNTTLLAGLAGTDDDVKVFYQTPRAKKRTNDVIVGVTQLLNARSSVSLNFGWGRQRGYLSDPYKLVEKTIELLPGVTLPQTTGENRPDEKEKWTVLVGWNTAFAEAHGAAEATYRYYHDTFGIHAHTAELAWFQRLGSRVLLRPGVRFYDQTAARFYHYRLDDTDIAPVAGAPRPAGPFYSSDHRLSALQTFTYGLKLVVNATDALQFDLAFERYDMRGTDRVTPQSAYSRANIISAGLKFAW